MKAKRIFEDYHRENGGGYGPVVKQLMLEFIHQRERLEREREDRHKADLANIEIDTTFKEQIKVLKGQVEALAESSRTSSRDARTANIISFASMAIALLAIILSIC